MGLKAQIVWYKAIWIGSGLLGQGRSNLEDRVKYTSRLRKLAQVDGVREAQIRGA